MNSVLVIGAGPAGCLAAILLARWGWHVTLIEQHRFPRDKVCGECISALGLEVLSRAAVLDAVRAAGATVLRQVELIARNGRSSSILLPRTMLGLSRFRMDNLLIQSAQTAGAHMVQPARCEGIDASSGLPTTQIRVLSINRIREMKADYVLLADGKSSLAHARPPPTGDMAIKAHFDLPARLDDAIELYGLDGHYLGLAPIERGLTNIAFSIPRWRLAAASSPEGLFAAVCDENRVLKQRMKGGRRVSDWLVSPLPRYSVQRAWPPRIIPIGNAAAALEPIGGEGIGLALASAELAAHALEHARQSNTPFDPRDLYLQYDRLWRCRRLACRAAAVCLSSPFLAQLTIALSENRDLSDRALQWIGKPAPQ